MGIIRVQIPPRDAGLPQTIIAYRARHGAILPYASAYTDKQIKTAIGDCRAAHGNDCEPRALLAEDYPPNTLRGMSA